MLSFAGDVSWGLSIVVSFISVLVTNRISWHFFLTADMEVWLFMRSLHSPETENFSNLLQIIWPLPGKKKEKTLCDYTFCIQVEAWSGTAISQQWKSAVLTGG